MKQERPQWPQMAMADDLDSTLHLDRDGSPTIPLTGMVRQRLRAEIRRTGVTAIMLSRHDADVPEGLNARMLNRWIGGIIEEAPQAHINYVLAKLASLPDREEAKARPRQTRWPRSADERWILLTTDMRTELSVKIEAAGVTPESLLAGATDLPERLSVRVVRSWIHGEVKSLNADHWAYVLNRLGTRPLGLSTVPFKPRKARNKIASNFPGHRALTDAERAALRAHRKRTGLGAARLLNDAADKPKGLSAAMISGWLTGKTQTADPALIAYVLARYADLSARQQS